MKSFFRIIAGLFSAVLLLLPASADMYIPQNEIDYEGLKLFALLLILAAIAFTVILLLVRKKRR